MNSDSKGLWFFMGTMIGVILFAILLIATDATPRDGYRRGQIDALSGKSIKYHLVVNPDSTRTWEEIPGAK